MKTHNHLALVFLLCAALAACAGPARLARDVLAPDPALRCSIERGMGGTGISGGERGMGGTGLMASSVERGMGGTGISAGVIGTVTGFGSICVSGVRVAYDETTPITAGNLPVALDALARGMTVAAVVAEQNGELKASRIEVLHAMVGPVTSITPFAVMGANVETGYAAGEAPTMFAVGDIVAVDGLQRPDGTIDATRLARAPAESAATVRGSVSLTRGVIRVGAVALAPSPGALRPGAWIIASGTWAGDRLTVNALSAAPEITIPVEARLSLEGYLLPQVGGGFAVRGVPVRENPERQLPRDVIARLAGGQRVQVIGVSELDGAVRPQTIVVPDFTSPLRAVLPTAVEETATEAAADTAARRRAAAAAAAATQTREALQLDRGTYGTTVTRPDALRAITPVVPDTIRTRPVPTRPSAPTRPTTPTRPDGVLQRPRG